MHIHERCQPENQFGLSVWNSLQSTKIRYFDPFGKASTSLNYIGLERSHSLTEKVLLIFLASSVQNTVFHKHFLRMKLSARQTLLNLFEIIKDICLSEENNLTFWIS